MGKAKSKPETWYRLNKKTLEIGRVVVDRHTDSNVWVKTSENQAYQSNRENSTEFYTSDPNAAVTMRVRLGHERLLEIGRTVEQYGHEEQRIRSLMDGTALEVVLDGGTRLKMCTSTLKKLQEIFEDCVVFNPATNSWIAGPVVREVKPISEIK